MRTLIVSITLYICAAVWTTVAAQDIPKVAFLYISPVGESGWTFEHERGRRMAEEAYAGKVQLDYFENIPDDATSADKMRELAEAGYDMIVATSYGYMNSAVQVAFEYPGLKIEHASGFVRTRNMSTYNARFYEGRVSQGIVAGHMTRTNKVGYIAGPPIPEVIRGINAAFLAARSVNPDIEFEVVWANGWFNPELEERLARELIAGGADILMQHTDTEKPVEVAEELGAFAFGQASDMRQYGNDAQLSATINHWGPYYIERIGALIDGTWQSQDVWGGLSDEMIEIAVFSDLIPLRYQNQAADYSERIRTNRYHPFTGPIRKQDGSGWLASGETASDTDLLTMDFFVEGIKGSIPN